MNAKLLSNFTQTTPKRNTNNAQIKLLSYRSVPDKRGKSPPDDDSDDSAVHTFLKAARLNSHSETNVRIALKFLSARPNVDKALQAYRAHEDIRRREGLHLIWVYEQALLSEIASSKFSVIPVIANNPIIMLFSSRMHKVSSSTTLLALRTFMCHLDAVIESNAESTRSGLILIYDMRGANFENFDYALGQKILKILKEACSVPLRAVYVVSPPSWFQAVYKVIFVDTQQMRSVLETLIPAEYLPPDFFGDANVTLNKSNAKLANSTSSSRGSSTRSNKLQSILSAWPRNCVRILLNSRNLFLSRYYTDKRPSGYQSSLAKLSHIHSHSTIGGAVIKNSKSTASQPEYNGNNVPYAPHTFYMSNVQLITVESFVTRLNQRKVWKYLDEEYQSVNSLSESNRSRREAASFWDPMNTQKNRYSNITCLEATRVVLHYSLDGNDYIHANFVDGAGQPRAFINTQGPLDSTIGDFWQMIWEQNVYIIVMVTKIYEDHKNKCGQYWPTEPNSPVRINDAIHVSNVTNEASLDQYRSLCGVNEFRDFKFTVLQLFNSQAVNAATGNPTSNVNDSVRLVYHFQFNGWPDHSVPRHSDSLLNMRSAIRNLQRNLVKNDRNWCGHPFGPPIVVHCSAGIGRTGTFCIIDICLSSLEQSIMSGNYQDTVSLGGGGNEANETMKPRSQTGGGGLAQFNSNSSEQHVWSEMHATMLSPPEVLLTLRSQRAHSVQNSRQYKFCYEAIFRYLTTCLSVNTRQSIINLISKELEVSIV